MYSKKRWFPKKYAMFSEKDIEVNGPLRKLILQCWKEVIDDKVNLKYNEDYNLKNVECDFQRSSPNSSTKSSLSLGFNMSLDSSKKEFPGTYSDESHGETQLAISQLKEKLSEAIFKEYKKRVTISITKWGFGSIRVGGSVIFEGEFSKEILIGILNVMKEQASGHFHLHSPTVDVQYEPRFAIDESMVIQFSLEVASADFKSLAKIHQKETFIEKMFIRNVTQKITEGTKLKLFI